MRTTAMCRARQCQAVPASAWKWNLAERPDGSFEDPALVVAARRVVPAHGALRIRVALNTPVGLRIATIVAGQSTCVVDGVADELLGLGSC